MAERGNVPIAFPQSGYRTDPSGSPLRNHRRTRTGEDRHDLHRPARGNTGSDAAIHEERRERCCGGFASDKQVTGRCCSRHCAEDSADFPPAGYDRPVRLLLNGARRQGRVGARASTRGDRPRARERSPQGRRDGRLHGAGRRRGERRGRRRRRRSFRSSVRRAPISPRWGRAPPGSESPSFYAPNFALGAVLMMRFARRRPSTCRARRSSRRTTRRSSMRRPVPPRRPQRRWAATRRSTPCVFRGSSRTRKCCSRETGSC